MNPDKLDLDAIEEMLDALPSDEWTFFEVSEDALTKTGALRTVEGQNIVEPGTESASMIVGLKPSIDFLAVAPQTMRALVNELRAKNK